MFLGSIDFSAADIHVTASGRTVAVVPTNQICVSRFVQARKASTREAEIATGERRLVKQVPSIAVGHGPAKWWAATGHFKLA